MTSMSTSKILARALDGQRPEPAEARLLAGEDATSRPSSKSPPGCATAATVI